MKIAFVYGGQGSQEVAMGYDFYKEEEYSKKFYDSIKSSKDIKELSFFSDENEIKKTENTQVIMVAFQAMITDLLIENNIKPSFVSGLSIGEFSALYAADIINKEELLSIADYRGEEMKKASANIKTSMYAVIGLDEEKIEDICKKVSIDNKKVSISNINTKNQIVISGEESAVNSAVEEIEKLKARTIKLNVSGPFHTEYMLDVSKKLEEYFENIEFKEEKIPVYYNYLGNKKTTENTKDLMTKQVSSTVRFKEDLENMINDGVDIFIEIGFSNVIKGFIKKIDRKVKVYSISTYDTFKELLKEQHYGK